MAVLEIPAVAYATPTGVIDATAQLEVAALINQFLALIPDPYSDDGSTGDGGSSPDYDAMRPEMAVNIRAELAAIIVAVDAAPVA